MAGAKKGAFHSGAMIVLLDETGFSQRPTVRRTWGRQGQTPVLHEHVTWDHFSAIGAIAFHPRRQQMRFFLSLRPNAINGEEIISFLRSLRRHVRDPVILVWDNLPVHRSKAVREYLEAQADWLHVERLPPYAPDLNPLEGVWANIDSRELANFVPDDMPQLQHQVHKGARRIRRHNTLLWGCFEHAGLTTDTEPD